MELKIRIEQTEPGVVTLLPFGSINTDTCMILDKEVEKLLTQAKKALVLDMAEVDFVSSAGIGTIAKTKNSLNKIGSDLAMINLQPQVKRVFEIIRLLPSMNVFVNTEELDEYLNRVQRDIKGEKEEY